MTVEKLLELQKLELEIDFIRSDAQIFPDRVAQVKNAESLASTNYGTCQAKIEFSQKEVRDLEAVYEQETERLKKSQAKLKLLKTNFEFQALNREIENTRRSNEEMYQLLSQKKEALTLLKTQLSELETKWNETKAAVSQIEEEAKVKGVEFDGILASKVEEQKKVSDSIDRILLNRYRFIRSRKYKDALVPILQNSCQGCFMNVPHQLMNEILRTRAVADCPHCHRMIYYKENA